MLLRSAHSDLALAAAYDRITPISIDYAVMEGAARDHRVVMGSMNVGWSDIGSWTALLDGLAGGRSSGATGRVLQPGDASTAGKDDLVVRSLDGRLIVDEPPAGTLLADGVWAHLSGARPLTEQIQAMIDRVQRQEVRS
jgi:mannose-1-phosphate guanylyltransferase